MIDSLDLHGFVYGPDARPRFWHGGHPTSRDHSPAFLEGALALAQRLHRLQLHMEAAHIRALLPSFWGVEGDPEALSTHTWPLLRRLDISPPDCDDPEGVTNEMLVAVGRALRQVPRLQRLKLFVGWRWRESVFFFRRLGPGGCARLVHAAFVSEQLYQLPTQVPSADVLRVWGDAVWHIADTSLELQVVRGYPEIFDEDL